MMVINFAVFMSGTHLTTPCSLDFHRIASFHPVSYVDIMYVLFYDVVAAKPVEVVPVSHLIFHLGLAWLSFSHPWGASHPIDLTTDDIAYGTIVNAFNGLEVIGLIMPL